MSIGVRGGWTPQSVPALVLFLHPTLEKCLGLECKFSPHSYVLQSTKLTSQFRSHRMCLFLIVIIPPFSISVS